MCFQGREYPSPASGAGSGQILVTANTSELDMNNQVGRPTGFPPSRSGQSQPKLPNTRNENGNMAIRPNTTWGSSSASSATGLVGAPNVVPKSGTFPGKSFSVTPTPSQEQYQVNRAPFKDFTSLRKEPRANSFELTQRPSHFSAVRKVSVPTLGVRTASHQGFLNSSAVFSQSREVDEPGSYAHQVQVYSNPRTESGSHFRNLRAQQRGSRVLRPAIKSNSFLMADNPSVSLNLSVANERRLGGRSGYKLAPTGNSSYVNWNPI